MTRPRAAAKNLLRPFYRGLVIYSAALIVKRRRPATIAENVDFVIKFKIRNFTIRPHQVRSEIEALMALLAEEKPRTVLEIGTALGGTLFLYTRVAAPDALLITVDLADATRRQFEGGDYKPNAPLYRAMARARQKVVFLAGDSHDPTTLDRVKAQLGGRPVDFLFIDGDHSYDGVRSDYEMYAPLVRNGGLVAFHDIVEGRPEWVGGVPQLWHEIKNDSATEFVKDHGQGGYGIGVLRTSIPKR